MRQTSDHRILTANDLVTGRVVYLDRAGGWSACVEQARILSGAEAGEAALRDAEERAGEVVGPYLASASAMTGRPVPAGLREVLRATGPSIAETGANSQTEEHAHVSA